MSYKDKIIKEKLPKHIAIIMDGNGRWARKHGQDRIFGHHQGVDAVRDIAEASAELGIKYLTLYAFSTENWNRPKFEVDALMNLFVETITKELDTLNKNNISLNAIGDLDSLPEENYLRLKETIDATASNDRMTLTLAMSYSSHWEIINAVRKILSAKNDQQLKAEDITEDLFSKYLTTAYMPDPELLIRTSGEMRISNFLLWQIAYAELYFTPKLWPEFTPEDLYHAIVNYQSRERRFGLTSEQIKS
ncbi:MAG TPA: isoprenyl transferase [Bacteroidetes bacterium]|nr:isoprenyl transferase [Bacteroidota bacterium]